MACGPIVETLPWLRGQSPIHHIHRTYPDSLCFVDNVEEDHMAILWSADRFRENTDDIERPLSIDNAHDSIEAVSSEGT